MYKPNPGRAERRAKGGLVGQRQVPQRQRQTSNAFNFRGGGDVTSNMSPSRGQVVDDVNANLNSGEFVIPRDVVQHKGHSSILESPSKTMS